jgi:uncharacterized membrane protein
MIEIIPNWHPIFVHFTAALFGAAGGFYVLSYLASFSRKMPNTLALEFEIVARWCLWAAALITIATVGAGLYAYYTVKHDAVSHAAMTVHRNWALLTATAIYLIAGWSVWRYYQKIKLTLTFVVALLVVQGLLLTTAWHGAELVYRYGVGVMSLPQAEEVGHKHTGTMAHPSSLPKTPTSNAPSHDKNGHRH